MRALFVMLALCWMPFASVPVSAQNDILIEDDFEAGQATPDGWSKGAGVTGVNYRYEKELGKSGSRSLVLDKQAKRYFPVAQWTRKLDHNSKRNALKVSIQAKADKVTKAIVDVVFLDAGGQSIRHQWASYIGARNAGDDPITHDWKAFTDTVAIPDGTATIMLALQIYGPGRIWFDDLKAVYVDSEKPEHKPGEENDNHIVEVSIGKHTGQYLYLPPTATDENDDAKKEYGLMLILPGGDGSADFHPFVKNIQANSLGDGFAVAQPIAKKWTSDQQIVWPHKKAKVKKMGFTTEQLIEAVISDVGGKLKLDKTKIYILAWSLGGPAAYAALLNKKTSLQGGVLAMSVFKPDRLPPLKNGKERGFYILHSPADRVCPYWMAEQANKSLQAAGIRSALVNYQGGHGWRGDVFGNIRKGVDWLSESK